MSTEEVVEETPAPASTGRSIFAPLRMRDIRLLVTGQMVSTLGDMVFLVALPFLILGSQLGSRGLSLTLTIFGLARIATALPGGALADRFGPRPVMLGADLIRCVVLTLLAVTAMTARPALGLLLACAAILGACEGAYQPAYRSITPELVPDAGLQAANGLGVTANLFANVIGPPVGGLLVAAFATGPAVLADSASFAVSVATLLLIRGGSGRRRASVPAGRRGGMDGAATGGAGEVAAFIRGSGLFRMIMLMTGMLGFAVAGTLEVALPVFARATPGLGATGYGYLMAALGAGLLIGGASIGLFAHRLRQGPFVVSLLAANGVLLAALPQLPGLAAMAAAMTVTGIFDGALAVIVLTLTQRMPPAQLRARVLAVLTTVTFVAYPLSVAIAGVVLARWSPAVMFDVTGAGFVLTAAAGLASRQVRQAGQPGPGSPGPVHQMHQPPGS
jgi:MFS family permease